MTDRELLARVAASPGQKAGYKQLVRELSLPGGRARRLLLEQLARLTVRGQLMQPDRDHWTLPRAASRDNLVAGRLDLHRDGYGFVRPNRKPSAADTKAPAAVQDIFIPPSEINAAMQGDQVLVQFDPPKADGRQQGRIVQILERRNPTVVGTFRMAREDRGRNNVVIPFDDRMTQPIVIPPGAEIPSAGGPCYAASRSWPRGLECSATIGPVEGHGLWLGG